MNESEIHQEKEEFLWDFMDKPLTLKPEQPRFLDGGLTFSLLPQTPIKFCASLRDQSFTLHCGSEFESLNPNPSQRIVWNQGTGKWGQKRNGFSFWALSTQNPQMRGALARVNQTI